MMKKNPEPDPYLVLMNPGPGAQKHMDPDPGWNDHGSNFTVERVGSETVRMDLDQYKQFADPVLDPDQTVMEKKCWNMHVQDLIFGPGFESRSIFFCKQKWSIGSEGSVILNR
jgi:hypothetical protein